MSKTNDTQLLSDELYQLSFDSIEEDTDLAWHSLIQNLSFDQLETLKAIFTETNENQTLNKEQFLNAIETVYGNSKYSVQTILLYDDINKKDKPGISWIDFIDYLRQNTEPKEQSKVILQIEDISGVPHTKKETIIKIVRIETEKYFCYAMISKHGRIGLYDGNLNFLTSYHLIITREDINKKDDERRRRNRWITDAVFCPDVLMFIITNTARSITIYEASGLIHVPLWLILTTPNIVQCLAYKSCDKLQRTENSLYLGDDSGQVLSLNFLQSKSGLFRRKHNDKISLFYWEELNNEKEFVIIKYHGYFHKDSIRHIKYFDDNKSIVTCSRDPKASVIIKFLGNTRKTYTFKLLRGVSCFILSKLQNVLITGTDDGLIHLWNAILPSRPIAVLKNHYTAIIDLQLMESQQLFLSCSRDGVLKLWDIKEHKCLQTIKIKFPSFGILGKVIEWGIESIYPGTKRILIDKNIGKEIPHDTVILDKKSLDIWERSYVLISCCNYMARIKLNFSDTNITKSFDLPILPPPPLQNSVLIPNTWKVGNDVGVNANEKQAADAVNYENLQNYIDKLGFILDKDLLEENGLRNDINYKLATLELKKLEMRKNVEKGAPYLALDLYDIQDMKLSDNLPIPNKKSIRALVEKTEQILSDAVLKNQIFSELSPSMSRSSKSSIVEFDF